jgi:hypothetical protein
LALKSSLDRYFQGKSEEEDVWKSLNLYSSRLETLGHAISLMMKRKEDNHYENQPADLRPVIAFVCPATSRGIKLENLKKLTLLNALFPSICATRSPGFRYKIYLVINEDDKIYSNPDLVRMIFDVANEEICGIGVSLNDYIDYATVVVPPSLTPQYALSGLFNLGTLAAYNDNCDFFYLVNDDLMLKSTAWSEIMTELLLHNPLFPGLGVAGGEDLSDTVTPHIEFPFFHRTHVIS